MALVFLSSKLWTECEIIDFKLWVYYYYWGKQISVKYVLLEEF